MRHMTFIIHDFLILILNISCTLLETCNFLILSAYFFCSSVFFFSFEHTFTHLKWRSRSNSKWIAMANDNGTEKKNDEKLPKSCHLKSENIELNLGFCQLIWLRRLGDSVSKEKSRLILIFFKSVFFFVYILIFEQNLDFI